MRLSTSTLASHLLLLTLSGTLCLTGCEERAPAPRKAQPATTPSAGPAELRRRATFPISAYRVRLDFAEDTVVLAASDGLRLLSASGSTTEIARAFGDTFALFGNRVVYFESGKLLESVGGAEPAVLGTVGERPRLVAVDAKRLVWVSDGPKGTSRLSTLSAGAPHEIATLAGRIDTLALSLDWVFFLEQGRPGTWRLGGVALDGGTPAFQDWQSGRVPSTLVARDDLYYYDGPSRSVHRLSPDFAQDEIVGRSVICSPLAVADRVVCARVGGLYELPATGGQPKDILSQSGFVTALSARDGEVAWVSDVGQDRLVLERRRLR